MRQVYKKVSYIVNTKSMLAIIITVGGLIFSVDTNKSLTLLDFDFLTWKEINVCKNTLRFPKEDYYYRY